MELLMIEHLKQIGTWQSMFQLVYEKDKLKRKPNLVNFHFYFNELTLTLVLKPIGTSVEKRLERLMPRCSSSSFIAFENEFFQVEIAKHEVYGINFIKLIWKDFDTTAVYE